MQYLKIVVCAALSLTLLACGGGGGNPGTANGGTPTPTTPVSTVASFTIATDKSTLTNSGSDKVTVTVQAVDANHNPVAGATVTGSVDTGVYTPTGTVTDASGNFVGAVTIGADKTNRNITLSITVNGIAKTMTIPVTGGQITMTPLPATPTPGQTVALSLQVQDVMSKGMGGVAVTLSGSAGFSGTSSADANGNLTVNGTAPATAGSYTIIATGAGLTASTTIQVAATGGNTIPPAVGLGTAQSLTANPTSIGTNATGVTANRAALSAKFLALGNTGIQNMRVRFELVPPVLGSGEFISTGTATVYSDVNGLATADYVAGTRSSPTNGVTLRACYATTDAGLTDPVTGVLLCPNSVSTTLTVNGQPLSVTIGSQNKLAAGPAGSYIEQFLIQVGDSAGRAVQGASVTPSVDITHFGKGPTWNSPYSPMPVPDITVAYGNSYNGTVYADNTPPTTTMNVWCMNEDINRNGTLDAGEDINGNGVLDPRKSDVLWSYASPSVNTTDANGQLVIQVLYPQNVGGWIAYTIKVSTSVVGSEGTSQRSFVTGVLQADVPNGAFLTPPYGSGRCIDPH